MNLHISAELSQLVGQQTEYFKKSDPTPSEVEEFQQAGERIRKLFAQLAGETMTCQIEYAASDSDTSMQCGKPAVVKCGDCGAAICDDCREQCCGDSFCGQCYDYHVGHSCMRKPVQNEQQILNRKAG